MALRKIRKKDEDEVLRKISKDVEVININVLTLLKDMAETMYKAEGLGLAAPQIGVLKRVVVIDIGEGLKELINPKVVDQSGEQLYVLGCLSVPGVLGEVKHPEKVKVEALDSKGEKICIDGEGLLAVVLCHEIDHLNGVLFTDKAIRILSPEELEERRKGRRQ